MSYCLQCGHKANLEIPEGDEKLRVVCPNCNYIHYENPKVICGALVIHAQDCTDTDTDKILLCRRAIEPRYGYWTLPAGFMEIGETMVQGAARETIEEADAIATDLQLYCVYDIPAIGQVYMLYLAHLKDGNFGVGKESLECGLFTENDIPWEEIAFEAVHRTLTHYFADKKQLSKDITDDTATSLSDFPLHQETIDKDKRITADGKLSINKNNDIET